jgi:hypothetical protein
MTNYVTTPVVSAYNRAFGNQADALNDSTHRFLAGLGYSLLNPVMLMNFLVYSTFHSFKRFLSVYDFIIGNLGHMTHLSMDFMLSQFKQRTVAGAFKGFLGFLGVLSASALVYGSIFLSLGLGPVVSMASKVVTKLPSVLLNLAKLTVPGLVAAFDVVSSMMVGVMKKCIKGNDKSLESPRSSLSHYEGKSDEGSVESLDKRKPGSPDFGQDEALASALAAVSGERKDANSRSSSLAGSEGSDDSEVEDALQITLSDEDLVNEKDAKDSDTEDSDTEDSVESLDMRQVGNQSQRQAGNPEFGRGRGVSVAFGSQLTPGALANKDQANTTVYEEEADENGEVDGIAGLAGTF